LKNSKINPIYFLNIIFKNNKLNNLYKDKKNLILISQINSDIKYKINTEGKLKRVYDSSNFLISKKNENRDKNEKNFFVDHISSIKKSTGKNTYNKYK
tara:strand:+ start:7886 stop:8179 length:294 start_codon:yes stop_codon:yes gene_type:complete